MGLWLIARRYCQGHIHTKEAKVLPNPKAVTTVKEAWNVRVEQQNLSSDESIASATGTACAIARLAHNIFAVNPFCRRREEAAKVNHTPQAHLGTDTGFP